MQLSYTNVESLDLDDLDKAYGYYEKHMWVEEIFRDLKSSITWLGISYLNHKKASSSQLFRRVRCRLGLVTPKIAA